MLRDWNLVLMAALNPRLGVQTNGELMIGVLVRLDGGVVATARSRIEKKVLTDLNQIVVCGILNWCELLVSRFI